MHRLKSFFAICSLLFIMKANAQHENKNWYFGTGTDGIIFDANNNPVKVSNKHIGTGYEGMIVVTDPYTGNLKFYSDGVDVIDKNHNFMNNGNGLTGHWSGAQGVQCCPVPGTCTKQYYLFTNSAWDLNSGAISYSIIDFTTNTLGDVINKNTLFWNGPSDEGMLLVNKPNSYDYWLIANEFNTADYHVWQITSAGISVAGVYSFSNTGSSYQIGYSQAAQKIVVTGWGNKRVTTIDFNSITGILSNEVQLGSATVTYSGGACFSPDGTKLYADLNPPTTNLFQYDFATSVWTNMNTCCYSHDLKTGPDGKMYHIHTFNSTQPMAVIDFPNNSAVGNACNYHTLIFAPPFNGDVRRFPEFVTLPAPPVANIDTISILTSSTINIDVAVNDTDPQGDPLILDSILYGPLYGTATITGGQISYTSDSNACGQTDTLVYRIIDVNCEFDTALVLVYINGTPAPAINANTPLCEGATLNLTASNVAGASYTWFGPGGFSASIQNPSIANILLADSGTYSVFAYANGCNSDTVTIFVKVNANPAVNLPPDTLLCNGAAVLLDAGPGYSYLWSIGLTAQVLNFNVAGTYTVTVTNVCGSAQDSIHISTRSTPIVNLGKDTTHCLLDSIVLNAPVNAANFVWSNGTTNQNLMVSADGNYWVIASNLCGSDTDSVTINFLKIPTVNLGNDSLLCNGAGIMLDAGAGYSYLWSNGATVQFQNFNTSGTYTVTVSNYCGSVIDNIHIDTAKTPVVNLGQDTTLCSVSSFILNAPVNASTYLWNDGTTKQNLTANSTGNYWVIATNQCGNDTDSVTINFLQYPAVSLGNDTLLCDGAALVLDADAGYNYLWSDGTSLQTQNVTAQGTYIVTVSNYCGSDRDTILITTNNTPVVSFGNDTSICSSSSIMLSMPAGNSYLWSTGSTTSSLTIVNAGIYVGTASNACGSSSDNFQLITVNPLPLINLGNDTTLCEGDTLLLNAGAFASYEWQDNTTASTLPANMQGLYWVEVIDINGCISRDSMQVIEVFPAPVYFLPADSFLCPGDPYNIISLNTYNNYLWNTGETGNFIKIDQPGIYQLTVTDQNGCTGEDTMNLEDYCPPQIFFPNGFTPNSDYQNDTWNPKGININYFEIVIYNRWGQKVFEGDAISKAWDGRYNSQDCPEGVYCYFAKYNYKLSSGSEIKKNQSGVITLMR